MQQGEVYELVNDVVVLGIVGNQGIALLLLLVDSLLGVGLVVLFLLGQLVVFLLRLLLVEHLQPCVEPLELTQYRLESFLGVGLFVVENLLDELVVGVEHDVVAVISFIRRIYSLCVIITG